MAIAAHDGTGGLTPVATSKIGLYNSALRLLGERSLASLTEARESRRVIDEAYDSTLAYCLEQGQWNFAIRSSELKPTPSIDPAFGYNNAYTKPSDWVRTVAFCSDEYFRTPLLQYTDEAGYWWTDENPIYVRYISNGASYGLDLSKWPATFARYVEYYLAVQVCERLTQNMQKQEILKKEMHRVLVNARSKDAMNEATIFPPSGSWVQSRAGGYSNRRYDRA